MRRQAAVPPGGDVGQIRSVQALRAVAALAVVAYHATVLWRDRAAPGTVVPWENGIAGVDLFFVISGFIMVVSSRRMTGRADGWRRFITLRLIRVVPLYWLATAAKLAAVATAPGLMLHVRPTLWNALASFLFIPSRNASGFVAPVLVVGWTLSFEMLFYVVFAIALAQRVEPATVVVPTMALLALSSVARGVDWPGLTTLADPIVLEFVLGVGLAHAFLGKRLEAIPCPLGVAAILGGMCGLALIPMGDSWTRVATWGVAAAAVLAGGLASERRLGHLLPGWLMAVGEASYSLYLMHGFVLPAVGALAARLYLPPYALGVLLISGCLASSTVLALIVHRYVEVPITLWLREQVRNRWPFGLTASQAPI